MSNFDLNRRDVRAGLLSVGGAIKVDSSPAFAENAAEHPGIVRNYPVIAEALLASASPQVRNLATLSGNLLQRTRCGYFRDVVTPCNKREPGSGCPAIDGQNRLHVIVGTSEHCIATYAGDLANALLVLDATVRVAGKDGDRQIPLSQMHRLPGDTPHLETNLHPGDLVLGIDIPGSAAARRSHYLKVRDRASFEWALASVAVALELDSAQRVRDIRVAVGALTTLDASLTRSCHAVSASAAWSAGMAWRTLNVLSGTPVSAESQIPTSTNTSCRFAPMSSTSMCTSSRVRTHSQSIRRQGASGAWTLWRSPGDCERREACHGDAHA